MANNIEIDTSKLSIVELKAHAYDQLLVREQANYAIKKIEEEINKRNANVSSTPQPKKADARGQRKPAVTANGNSGNS